MFWKPMSMNICVEIMIINFQDLIGFICTDFMHSNWLYKWAFCHYFSNIFPFTTFSFQLQWKSTNGPLQQFAIKYHIWSNYGYCQTLWYHHGYLNCYGVPLQHRTPNFLIFYGVFEINSIFTTLIWCIMFPSKAIGVLLVTYCKT